MRIYRAYYESRNFDFEGFSEDKQRAIDTVITALEKHTIEYNLAPDWWELGGIECDSYILNQSYRDREEL
jgi:hypothetical protein